MRPFTSVISIEEVICKPSIPLLPTECLIDNVRKKCETLLKKKDLPLPVLWLLSDEPPDECEHVVKELEPIICSEEFRKSSDRYSFLLRHSPVNDVEIQDIANITVGQMSNPLYCRYKIMRLTTSNFGKILSAKHRQKYCATLFKRLSWHNSDFDKVRCNFKSVLF